MNSEHYKHTPAGATPEALPAAEVEASFRKLRFATQQRMCGELSHRIATCPTPTPFEESMGLYQEPGASS